ncbi:hypothetical protein TNCT_145241 [Trichonephila clavata]|uniref:Uncharacterized protein n=1 Tax=Trichonephila clavata TaxID=2740835 RepID=A0A8X6LGX7_TRICU|nr:hypothetical protein TNCT_145241 [Trichonephila clavata]
MTFFVNYVEEPFQFRPSVTSSYDYDNQKSKISCVKKRPKEDPKKFQIDIASSDSTLRILIQKKLFILRNGEYSIAIKCLIEWSPRNLHVAWGAGSENELSSPSFECD